MTPRQQLASSPIDKSFTSSASSDDANAPPESFPKSCWKTFSPDDLGRAQRYGLCISSVVPRPVGVLSTISSKEGDGIVNCAPYSYTSLAAHDPPIVTHGICLSGGKKKDTLANIEVTEEWVYNVLSTSYLEEANECSATLPPDVDELKKVGNSLRRLELPKPRWQWSASLLIRRRYSMMTALT
mmetsp:Transcript_432/g.614  ORF Transcript_432/g.614 Transcript_432/m.614 type:complete len:184 (+) Transcript_432:2249-2800(+)